MNDCNWVARLDLELENLRTVPVEERGEMEQHAIDFCLDQRLVHMKHFNTCDVNR
jgi:hypothetical protein